MSNNLTLVADDTDIIYTSQATDQLQPEGRQEGRNLILIADDDDDIRDAIAFKLEMSGFRTLTADNGRSALAMATTERPRLAILDVRMPRLDGLTVCYELHSDPETAQIPVLMLSASGRPTDVDLGFTVGADDYLAKPFNPTELLRRVNWLLLSNGS